MTTLPDVERSGFIRQLSLAVEAARATGTHVGLLLVDLVNLATVNHYRGYESGDRLLQVAHARLLQLSRLPGTVFRVGSHRFSFILPDLGNPGYIALALNRVQQSLTLELRKTLSQPGVEVRIGVAVNHHGLNECMDMLAQAETSLQRARLGGIERLDAVLVDDAAEASGLELEQRLSEALQDNAFELHFQPKIDLATGALRGAEAVLRWPDSGVAVSPEQIAEWAETSGHAFDLTKWVVHRGLRQLRAWQGHLDIAVALNVPANLAGDPDLPVLVQDAMAIWGVDPRRVIIEITERGIIEDKQSGFDNLLKLREMGVTLSIDDFGTGYSSLSYFKHIPATELKIDKSFIESMLVDDQDMELVRIIIDLGHRFGLSVVAEGVEDPSILERLRDLGCDQVQGYLLSRPLAPSDFESWARHWSGLAPFKDPPGYGSGPGGPP